MKYDEDAEQRLCEHEALKLLNGLRYPESIHVAAALKRMRAAVRDEMTTTIREASAPLSAGAEFDHCYRAAEKWALDNGMHVGQPCPTLLVRNEREAVRAPLQLRIQELERESRDKSAEIIALSKRLGQQQDEIERLSSEQDEAQIANDPKAAVAQAVAEAEIAWRSRLQTLQRRVEEAEADSRRRGRIVGELKNKLSELDQPVPVAQECRCDLAPWIPKGEHGGDCYLHDPATCRRPECWKPEKI